MIRMVEFFDRLLRIAAATHPDAIQTETFCMISLNDGKRRGIFDDDRIAADQGLETDPAELMNTLVSSNICAVRDLHVPGQCCCVRHYYMVTDAAVMGDVCLCHQQAVTADLC